MKNTFLLFVIILLQYSCTNNPDKQKIDTFQRQIDTLNKKLTLIKPGLGEIMSTIQVHHEKLWFAATNENWKLSEYEIGELKEAFEQAFAIETDRPETKNIPMILPVIDSLSHAIDKKDVAMFKKNYLFLTNTCNNCHTLNQHEFNVITIPTSPPVTDQEFKTKR